MVVVKRFNVNREQVPLDKDFINVNLENNHETAYSSSTAARNAVPVGYRKTGLQITYLLVDGWFVDQYVGSDISGWETASNWKFIGPIVDNVTNPEWLSITTDKDGRIIEGINKNGEKIFGVIPPQIKQYIDENMPIVNGVSEIEYDDVTGDIYATYDDKSGITDVYMEPNGDIYVESEE